MVSFFKLWYYIRIFKFCHVKVPKFRADSQQLAFFLENFCLFFSQLKKNIITMNRTCSLWDQPVLLEIVFFVKLLTFFPLKLLSQNCNGTSLWKVTSLLINHWNWILFINLPKCCHIKVFHKTWCKLANKMSNSQPENEHLHWPILSRTVSKMVMKIKQSVDIKIFKLKKFLPYNFANFSWKYDVFWKNQINRFKSIK